MTAVAARFEVHRCKVRWPAGLLAEVSSEQSGPSIDGTASSVSGRCWGGRPRLHPVVTGGCFGPGLDWDRCSRGRRRPGRCGFLVRLVPGITVQGGAGVFGGNVLVGSVGSSSPSMISVITGVPASYSWAGDGSRAATTGGSAEAKSKTRPDPHHRRGRRRAGHSLQSSGPRLPSPFRCGRGRRCGSARGCRRKVDFAGGNKPDRRGVAARSDQAAGTLEEARLEEVCLGDLPRYGSLARAASSSRSSAASGDTSQAS